MDTLSTAEQFNKLIAFRQAAYDCLGNVRDAQFELTDAVLLTWAANSFVELFLSPVFRRLWPSSYEAIQDGQPDREGLLRLYLAQIPSVPRPLLAGDHTAWPWLSAPKVPERTIEHQPTKIVGNKPITVGWGFSTLAFLPQVPGGWALGLLHERKADAEAPIDKGAGQLRRVTPLLSARPISLWDSEYGNATFVNTTADIAADKILRLRPNLCLWGPPPPYSGRGRPPVHGAKFKLKDPTTWPTPLEVLEVDDSVWGRVRVSLWRDLHFRRSPAQGMVVIRLERLDACGTRRDPKGLWLA